MPSELLAAPVPGSQGCSQPAVPFFPFFPAPPKLLIGDGESHLTAVANESLRIRCRASGVPVPRIQ